MESKWGLAIGAVAISAGVSYQLLSQPRQFAYPFDKFIDEQSYIVEGTLNVRRSHPDPENGVAIPYVHTVYDLFEHGLKLSEHSPCFGYRSSSNDPYNWMSYAQVKQKIHAVSFALCAHRCSASSAVGIQSKNSPEWLIMQLACAFLGHPVVPLYETFGPSAMDHIIHQTEPEFVLCETVEQARNLLDKAPPCLRHVIVSRCSSDELDALHNGTVVQIHRFEDFSNHNSDISTFKSNVDPASLYLVCYTSGCSGLPKGVRITHEQFIWTIKCLTQRLEDPTLSDSPRHMCYLPLAHILEQLASSATLFYGGRIGFLTSDYKGLIEDLQHVRPTYFFTVPRVLFRVYSMICRRIASYPLLPRAFEYAIDRKNRAIHSGRYELISLPDLLFFRKARYLFGGSVKAIVCGGAPASEQILRFTRAAFNCPVIQAYGLTETCGVVSLAYFGDAANNHVGALLPGLTARLADVPEIGLNAAEGGVGELLVKGPNCTTSYFQNPELTSHLIDSEGWIHTGDIAQWSSRGELQIIGRCKAAFKLSQGEYVSPDRVEAIYQLSSLVDHVYVEGRSIYDFPVAIVVPHLDELRRLLDGRVSAEEAECPELLCELDQSKSLVLSELNEIGRANGLKGFEQVKVVHLTPSPFTIENALLTANLKLSRAALRQYYAQTIDHLYASVC